MAAIHETASDLFRIGLMNKATMRDFDEACLTPVEDFTPKDIRELREREQVSQVILARYLNVSKGMISKWECGQKPPNWCSKKTFVPCQEKGISRNCIK